jgi:hypothetical protein
VWSLGQRFDCFVVVAAVLAAAAAAHAGGPILVNGAGEALVWRLPSIPYNPDRGSLGGLTNSEARQRMTSAASAWTAVPTSSVSIVEAAQVAADITPSNFLDDAWICGDGLSPVVFDADGSIVDMLFGQGASNSVLGFAAAMCGDLVLAEITEGIATINGRFVDGVDSASNPEITRDELETVLVHELGHYVGLDHSQVGLQQVADAVSGEAVATMFPFHSTPEQLTLHLDDMVSVSSLYPELSFESDFGELTGSVFLNDGVTLFQGANVVARLVSDPLVTAVSQVSGAHYFPGNAGGTPDPSLAGRFQLKGLPPGDYTVEVEPVYGEFTGGSSVGPVETPNGLPGAPEFWNGANEAGSNPPDDPTAAEQIPVTAASTTSGIDFVLNLGSVPPNDECMAATVVGALPFAESLDVTGALRGAFDPLQECNVLFPAQNHNSVWYRVTTPVDGVLRVNTSESNYDTVVTLSTGECGELTQVACNNNGGPALTSKLAAVVEAGATYIAEITSAQYGGGLLEVSMELEPFASCPTVPMEGCTAPATATGSSLKLRRGDDPSDSSAKWKWGPGVVAPVDLGDPTLATGTSYAFCIYDGGGVLRMEAQLPTADRCGAAPEDCWESRSGRLSYKDRLGLPDGLSDLKIKSSDEGRGKLTLKGRGGNLGVAGLPFNAPVAAMLLNSDGNCWQSVFPEGGIRRNDEYELSARGQ